MTPAELRSRRLALRLTQAELAAVLGVAANTVARWERGESQTSIPGLMELALERLEHRAAGANAPVMADRAAPAEPGAVTHAQDLPFELNSFIDREAELVELTEMLKTTRLLTLTGPAGVGKTRLALRLAAAVRPDFPHGVALVELARLVESTTVAETIAATLGAREQPGVSPRISLLTWVGNRELLLVLDNCEHLVATCAEVVETLLRACPNMRVLATSREALLARGETAWPLRPLSIRPRDRPIAPFADCDAMQLFVDRARAASPDFQITEHSAPFVAEICRELDGLPLALELAAARVRLLAPEQIATRLNNRFDLLVGGLRTGPLRHRTLEAAVEWSYLLLSSAEQLLFERLGVFVGGWTLEAAETVCSGSDLLSGQILEALAGLVEKSLVVVEERMGNKRYRLLESLRHYAWRRLLDRDGEERVVSQHAAFFERCVTTADAGLWKQHQSHIAVQIQLESGNISAALRVLIDRGDTAAAQRVAGAMARFWHIAGRLSEGRALLAETLALTGADSPAHQAARGRALIGEGNLASYQGDFAAAKAALDAGAALVRAVEDLEALAEAQIRRAMLASWQADQGDARGPAQEALALSRHTGQRVLEAHCLQILGSILRLEGDEAAAKRHIEQAEALLREQGVGIGMVLLQRGWQLYLHGQQVAAQEMLDEALAQLRVEGFGWQLILCLLAVASVYLARDLEQARALYTEGLTLAQNLGAHAHVLLAIEGFALLAVAHNQPELALQLAGAAAANRAARGVTAGVEEQALLATWLERARRALGPIPASVAWTAGQRWSLPHAIEVALERPLVRLKAETPAAPGTATAPRLEPLSEREREVALLTSRGLSNRNIAAELVISERTVEAHLDHIRTKLNLHSRTEVVAWVLGGSPARTLNSNTRASLAEHLTD